MNLKYYKGNVASGETKQIDVGYGLLVVRNGSIGSCAVYLLSSDSQDTVHLIHETPSGVQANITAVTENKISVGARNGGLQLVCIGY